MENFLFCRLIECGLDGSGVHNFRKSLTSECVIQSLVSDDNLPSLIKRRDTLEVKEREFIEAKCYISCCWFVFPALVKMQV